MSWVLSAFTDEGGEACDQQIANARKAGLSHVDLRGVDGHNISQLPLDVAEKVAAKLGAAGLKVCMFGSPLGKIDLADDFKIDQDKLEHMGKLKSILGTNQVRIFSYYNKKAGKNPQQFQAASLDWLSRLREQAGRLGLVLYHENERHIFGDPCEHVQTIAEKLRDGRVFKLIFDFDNYNQSGEDVWANWTKLRDVTDAFHLKDSDEKGQHVPAGQGAGQVKRILTDAVARKWSGPVILEPHLSHSSAVMATGPGGKANRKLKDMPPAETFQVAAKAARDLLAEVGASIV